MEVNSGVRYIYALLGVPVQTIQAFAPESVGDRVHKIYQRGEILTDAFEGMDLSTAHGRSAVTRLGSSSVRHLLIERFGGQDQLYFNPRNDVVFDLQLRTGDFPELEALSDKAEDEQWKARQPHIEGISNKPVDWATPVDPLNPEKRIFPHELLPVYQHRDFQRMSEQQRTELTHRFLQWMLSQFYFGELGAQAIASHLATAAPWHSARRFAATQVMDESRHVEVFGRYIGQKMGGLVEVDPFLMTILDALIQSKEWDIKFLGMQILIEGLAMGSFGTLYSVTDEPLLKGLLYYIMKDEARHVHFGVEVLKKLYTQEFTQPEINERKELAAQLSHLMYHRFLGDRLRREYFDHIPRREWNGMVSESRMMAIYRKKVFTWIMNKLHEIGLIDREHPGQIERRYRDTGLFDLIGKETSFDLMV